ncbi:Serine/arginine repetitive matrix protein [Penicillium chrysogenum]|uniref:Pc20g06520 protein n=2 Tax=Penicillium chrysogenum species complex TaxID=254878 RepID=B6HGU9_PENRW|nr:Serine/arginine repetitive matrix protein [Penicillium chrysogenum]CAP85981.1 Pc20g06520 [Penicillium rubens Wisconsin 54-1255]
MASSVDAKLIRQTKFPPEFNKKVDMTKVNVEVMKKWIASQISKILGNEDDVVIELCFAHLEGSRFPDIKHLQIQLTGFLDKDTPKFCQELWSLCLSGQENPQGVPKELLEAKKLELIQGKVILEAEKASEALRRQREQDQTRERELDDVRRRERSDRGRGGRGGDRGGRGGRGRDFNRRYSPPRDRDRSRDRFREPASRRDFDSYVPAGNRRGRRSSRSPRGTRSPSRSPNPSSPPRRNRDEPRHRRRERRSRSPSNPVSPERRSRGGARRRSSPDYGDRVKQRPISRSRSPRSRSPRGYRRRQSSVPRSVSRSRSRRSSARYARRDSRRLSRSRSRSTGRTGTRDRGENRRRRSPSGGRSRSRSPSAKKDTDGKRRRSIERYNPDEKRRKMADENEDSTPTPSKSDEPSKTDDNKTKVAEQTKKSLSAWVNSTGFREKLLRERCIAMRRRSSEQPSSASPPKQD